MSIKTLREKKVNGNTFLLLPKAIDSLNYRPEKEGEIEHTNYTIRFGERSTLNEDAIPLKIHGFKKGEISKESLVLITDIEEKWPPSPAAISVLENPNIVVDCLRQVVE